ncbi:HU family DNA-binding protein [Marinifilum fragile]|uniref:HU family DNA-binding protein n=1 Tax=Marinifilum fragile TaxID=570161 RepID=UPI002AA90042|nr:HU family DNA-binding protein [Marinifilum fragile]
MSLDYKVVEKGQPGVAGGGTKKIYAQIVNGKEATIDELVDDIEKFSALSEADIRGVIIALENEIQKKLAQGRIVRLEKLDSLYPAISSKGEEEAEKVTSASIRKVGVNYRAGSRILKTMQEAGFNKI